MIRSLDKQLIPLGLSYGRYAYLFALYIQDGRSQQDLANSVGTDKAAATRALSKLAADGLIERMPDPADKRAVKVYVTGLGKAQRPLLEKAASDAIEDLTDGLDPEQQQQLRALLAAACQLEP